MADQEANARDFAERVARLEPLPFTLSPYTAVVIVSQIQLALRHPGNVGELAKQARHIARTLQERLAEQDPEVGRYLEQGWHEVFDIRSE
jgi:hypothetical protein